jgi:hypothetical protein
MIKKNIIYLFIILISSNFFSQEIETNYLSIEEFKELIDLKLKIGDLLISEKDFIGTYSFKLNNDFGYNFFLIICYEITNGKINFERIKKIESSLEGDKEFFNRMFKDVYSKEINKTKYNFYSNKKFYLTSTLDKPSEKTNSFWKVSKNRKTVNIINSNIDSKGRSKLSYFLERKNKNTYICYSKVSSIPKYKEKSSGILKDLYFEIGILSKIID